MGRGIALLSAVVAHPRPLERNLIRFLVEEAGYAVVAEAGTAHETVRAVARHHPLVVVVHESAARHRASSIVPRVHRPVLSAGGSRAERGATVIRRIRQASPTSMIIALTSGDTPTAAPTIEGADAVVRESDGVQGLDRALAEMRRSPSPSMRRTEAEVSAGTAPRHPRWLERLEVIAAASILILAVVIAGPLGEPPPAPFDPAAGQRSLHDAYRSLIVLRDDVATARPERIASLARNLIETRAMAEGAGVETSELEELDAMIAEELGSLLPSLPAEAQATLVAVLGGLLVEDEAPPEPSVVPLASPEPRPSPLPTAPPEPDPDPPPESPLPAPEPLPTEPPPPSPSPTPTSEPSQEAPSPTATPSPAPTPTPEPSPEAPSPTPPPSVVPDPPTEPVPPSIAPDAVTDPVPSEAPPGVFGPSPS